MPNLACELPSPQYRYLQTFFESGPYPLMADPLGLAPEKERKIDVALAQLEDGIKGIFESDNYREYLRTLGKFHDYSLGNLILIWIQNKNATRVAGFNTWKDLGRFVKKGQKGMMILAPCFPPKGRPEPKPKPESKPEGEEEEEENPIVERPVFFKVVYVFDIAQTEGKDLPEVEVPIVQGEDSGPLFDIGLQYCEKNGLKVLDKPKAQVSSETMGYFAPQTREIWVRGNVPKNQQTKSLFHEIAHSRAADKFGPEAEVLAESVAFAVCNHFGFDTGARSFPYVAVWARDVKVLKQKLDQVRAVTKDIIEEITILAELRDPGRLEDFGGLGASIISGLGFGIGIKALNYLTGKVKDHKASLDDYATEGLACKICGRPVPPRAFPEVWAGYHIKYEHPGYVKTLAKDRLPWVAGLTIVGEDYPARKAALEKLKPYTIIFTYDDGDLKVLSGGKEWVVTKEGKAYVNHKLKDPGILEDATLEKMMLLTKEIRKSLPPIKSTEHDPDPLVRVKFFTPWTYWTWYATEFDGEDEFFGLVRGHEIEMGYFSLKELENVRGPFGLTIERDRHFEPMPLSKVREKLEAGNIADSEGTMAERTSEKDLEQKIKIINRGLAMNNIGRKIELGKRYGYKALDVYDAEGRQLRTIRTGLSSSQVDLILDGMLAMIDFYEALARDADLRQGPYVYIQSEPHLWTVGFYDPSGKWHPDSDHSDRGEAGERVHYLNCGLTDSDLEDLTPTEKDRMKIVREALALVGKADVKMAKAAEFSFYVDEALAEKMRRAWGTTMQASNEISDVITEFARKDLNFARAGEVDIEDLADEWVLPEMKLYSGDKLSLSEIKGIVSKSRIAGKPPAFTDKDLEAALDYLEEGGEILSFEKTAEKPKRWTALHYEDSVILAASKEIPKLIEVYKTTIVKHYRAKTAFHRGSFRVLKSPGTLVWLGCLKTAEWKGKVCSENQALHKTIHEKTARGMKEVRKLKDQGIEVKYYSEEGIEPRASDDILEEIARAMNEAQPVEG